MAQFQLPLFFGGLKKYIYQMILILILFIILKRTQNISSKISTIFKRTENLGN